jgi:hypothetical protein
MHSSASSVCLTSSYEQNRIVLAGSFQNLNLALTEYAVAVKFGRSVPYQPSKMIIPVSKGHSIRQKSLIILQLPYIPLTPYLLQMPSAF